jgi:hypothetical protein
MTGCETDRRGEAVDRHAAVRATNQANRVPHTGIDPAVVDMSGEAVLNCVDRVSR